MPPLGFLAEHPFLIAFYAKRFNGVDYPSGAMFTVRSLDDHPIDDSRRIRVYHGFGSTQIKIGTELISVKGEQIIETFGDKGGYCGDQIVKRPQA